MEAYEERSDGLGGGDEDGRTSYVREKLRGKQPIEDEPSSKRKKTSSSCHHEEGGVNIGGPTPHRRRRTVVLDSPNDNGAAMLPSLTFETLPLVTHAGAEMKDAASVGGHNPSS